MIVDQKQKTNPITLQVGYGSDFCDNAYFEWHAVFTSKKHVTV